MFRGIEQWRAIVIISPGNQFVCSQPYQILFPDQQMQRNKNKKKSFLSVVSSKIGTLKSKASLMATRTSKAIVRTRAGGRWHDYENNASFCRARKLTRIHLLLLWQNYQIIRSENITSWAVIQISWPHEQVQNRRTYNLENSTITKSYILHLVKYYLFWSPSTAAIMIHFRVNVAQHVCSISPWKFTFFE